MVTKAHEWDIRIIKTDELQTGLKFDEAKVIEILKEIFDKEAVELFTNDKRRLEIEANVAKSLKIQLDEKCKSEKEDKREWFVVVGSTFAISSKPPKTCTRFSGNCKFFNFFGIRM